MVDMWPITPTPNASQAFTGTQIGNNFTVSAGQDVDTFQYYRSILADGAPSYLTLWNVTDAIQLLQLTAPTDPGGTGWIAFPMGTTISLVTGKTYCVTYVIQGGNTGWGWSSGPPTPNSPFSVTGARYNGDHTTIPTSVSGWEAVGVGVALTAGGGGGGSGVLTSDDLAAIDSDLASWLSSVSATNTHQTDGLPWLTKTVVDAIKVVTDKLGHSGSGNSLDWITALWRLAGDLTDAEIGYLKNLLDHQSQIVGASGGGGSAFYGPSGTQVAEGVETLLASGVTPTALGAALALLREQLTLSPDLADTSRWTLVDTTSGEGDALVSQQADAYFLSITAYPPSQAAHGVAATLWLPRWGWVCPRVHGHFSERQFHDVMPTIITSEGHLMDGLLIYTPMGYEWTCESYVLDR